MERKIGGIFEFEGVKLQVVEACDTFSCDGCYFLSNEQNMCKFQKCLKCERNDWESVVFQFVE